MKSMVGVIQRILFPPEHNPYECIKNVFEKEGTEAVLEALLEYVTENSEVTLRWSKELPLSDKGKASWKEMSNYWGEVASKLRLCQEAIAGLSDG